MISDFANLQPPVDSKTGLDVQRRPLINLPSIRTSSPSTTQGSRQAFHLQPNQHPSFPVFLPPLTSPHTGHLLPHPQQPAHFAPFFTASPSGYSPASPFQQPGTSPTFSQPYPYPSFHPNQRPPSFPSSPDSRVPPLSSLVEVPPPSRPQLSIPALITSAILSTPSRKSTVSQIVQWITDEHPEETRKRKTWEDLVRGCLNADLGNTFVATEGGEGGRKRGRVWSVKGVEGEGSAGEEEGEGEGEAERVEGEGAKVEGGSGE